MGGFDMKRGLAILSALFILALSGAVFAGEWVQDGSNWKYKEDDGSFLTSSWKFLKVGNDYSNFYFDENGHMATGLKRIDGEVYAFREDGTTITNSTVTIDGEKFDTKNKGLVEGVPTYFDVDEYNAKLLAEKQKKESEEAARIAKQKAIEESIANRSPEELASIAASEAAVEASIAAAEAAEEAARIELINKTIRIGKTLPDAVTVKGEGNGKVVITILIPTLVGGNSDVINPVLAEKIKNEVYTIYEERFGKTTSKLTFKAKDVFLDHKLDQHILKFSYWDTDGYQMFTLYLDTVSLEMWSD